jgi:hypothetical protein
LIKRGEIKVAKKMNKLIIPKNQKKISKLIPIMPIKTLKKTTTNNNKKI